MPRTRFSRCRSVQFSDSGLYYAQVTNAFGSATTPSVRLTVVPGMEIQRVGAITNAQWVYTLDVVGHLAYVGIEGNGGGLKIYEVQDPAAPVLLGGLALDNSQQYVGVSDVVVSGERAYIAAGHRGLQVIDVSNPAEPARIGQYATTVSATDLIIREPIVYVATSRGVQIVDVSNPAAISLVASYATPASVYTLDLDGDSALRGSYLRTLSISLMFPTQRRRASLAG